MLQSVFKIIVMIAREVNRVFGVRILDNVWMVACLVQAQGAVIGFI